jgi:hypothetical protein
VVLSEEFAALHLRFAARVSRVEGIGLREALERWTPARRQAAGAWSEIGAAPGAGELARAYRSGPIATTVPAFGCFWYSPRQGGVIRLHFANRDGRGVLAPDRLGARRHELAAMLRDARQGAERVVCGSWLYHLPRYRALFPPSLLATAAPADPRHLLTSGSLWGQFLRGDGGLYEPRARAFVDAFERADCAEELLAAFPLTRLGMTGSIDHVLAWLESGLDR